MNRTYAFAALLPLVHGAFGCELIVGDDSRHVEDEGGTTADADPPPRDAAKDTAAVDAAPPHEDSAPPVDAGCGAACATTQTSCTSGCTSTETTCNASCNNNIGCQHQCQMTELQCAMACQSACTSCAAPDHCAPPGPCGTTFP